MTERKFTDEDLIKALEHCTSSTTGEACNGCPFCKTDVCVEMDNALNIYALDLINRQRAEIERLTIKLDAMRSAANSFKMHYNNGRSEAIKEFADGVENDLGDVFMVNHPVVSAIIDKRVKEMTEGDK